MEILVSYEKALFERQTDVLHEIFNLKDIFDVERERRGRKPDPQTQRIFNEQHFMTSLTIMNEFKETAVRS